MRTNKPASKKIDLNAIPVENDGNFNPSMGQTSATSSDGTVTVYLRNLEYHLLEHIRTADCIVGCIAWLTNSKILKRLSEIKHVAIVVQKEDFLRPDLNSGDTWREHLRSMYSRLRCGYERYNFPGLVSNLSIAADSTMDSVRCLGNYNRDKHPAFPRMHHKFIVFCRSISKEDPFSTYSDDNNESPEAYTVPSVQPYAVWTGSFNFTENAVNSLENGLYITDLNIVQAYYDEWARAEAISEPLDWESDWVAPEWRIGT